MGFSLQIHRCRTLTPPLPHPRRTLAAPLRFGDKFPFFRAVMSTSIPSTALLFSMAFLMPAMGVAQQDTTLNLDLQMRVRSEWRDGYKVATATETPRDVVTVQRSRIGLRGKWKSFDYKLSAQDIRTFGGPAGQTQGTIGISEAWWSSELVSGMVLKVGRQEIKFDNERIVGAVDWSNPGRFLDGVRWDRRKDRPDQGNSTAALTWDELNQTSRYMLYHRAMVGQGNKLTFLVFAQRSETEPEATFFGFTTRFKLGSNGWFATETYFEPVQDNPPFSAYPSLNIISGLEPMLNADVGINGESGHQWQLGVDLVSPGFQPFLGTNHRHYGWMDQFYVGTQSAGLTDLRLRHTAPLNFRLFDGEPSWGASFHHFRSSGFGNLLGNELDLWITGNNEGVLTWHIGFSALDATARHIERQGDVPQTLWNDAAGRIQHWGWVSLNFTPSFVLR